MDPYKEAPTTAAATAIPLTPAESATLEAALVLLRRGEVNLARRVLNPDPALADDLLAENRLLRRERTQLRKALKSHTEVARKVIAAMDAEMKKPSDSGRGGRVAKIIGALEWTNDSARHFALGEEFPLKR